jgi:ribose transport system substrate-binding protein
MKRVFAFTIAAGILAFVGPLRGDADAQEPKRLRIALIGKSMANPVFLAAHQGALDEAKAAGLRHGLSIHVALMTPKREDPAQQLAAIQTAVGEGYDAVLIAPSDVDQIRGAIDDAVEAGVAVMTFDNPVPGSRAFSHYGPDDEDIGTLVMNELADQIGGEGQVGLLAGNPNAGNLRARTAGVQAAAGAHPDIELLGPFFHEEKPLSAAEEVLRVSAEYPELKGWAMIGGWPLFRSSKTLALIQKLQDNDIKVVAVDALPDQLHYVDKDLALLFAQPVYDWGRIGVSTIVDELRLGKHAPKQIRMELVRVNRDNLGDWARQLKEWGFTVDPSQYDN